MEKAPAHRYASAAALADDLHSFLRHEPILARPPGRLYRVRKFAQRNKGLVAGTGAVFLAQALGLVGTALGSVAARREGEHARRRQEAELAALGLGCVEPADHLQRGVGHHAPLDLAGHLLSPE
jgi:hypothetical protein